MYVHSLCGKKANIGEKDRKGDMKAILAALSQSPSQSHWSLVMVIPLGNNFTL